jgi:hypothetical protein
MPKIICLLLLILGSCSILSPRNSENQLFYLEKTACYGECPVYTLKIYSTGKMEYYGIRNTKFTGEYCADIPNRELEKLKLEFKKEKYFAMQDVYQSKASDLPTTITGYSERRNAKRITDYDKAPEALKHLEKMLEMIADTTNWVKCK